jgi:hypothetical protein
MPRYDLQAGTSGSPVGCGNVIVSMSGGVTSINYRPQGQNGNGTAIPGAAYNAAGGGTATSPNPGDTLNLNNYQVTIGTTTYTFGGTATFQDRNGNTPKGYYHLASLTGQVGDWDCADDGSGES